MKIPTAAITLWNICAPSELVDNLNEKPAIDNILGVNQNK
jgi:hypothetical protein